MESSEISEELTDWEEIQHPFSHQPSSPPPQGQQPEIELIVRNNFCDDDFSIFPPSEHENLPLLEDHCESPENTLSGPLPLPFTISDTDSPQQQRIRSNSKISIVVSEIGTVICTIGRRMLASFASNCSRRLSSFIPASVLVVVIFACVKIFQWRNQLLLLIREKDQRISQLLDQIAHMNQILSARRKVPILRIK